MIPKIILVQIYGCFNAELDNFDFLDRCVRIALLFKTCGFNSPVYVVHIYMSSTTSNLEMLFSDLFKLYLKAIRIFSKKRGILNSLFKCQKDNLIILNRITSYYIKIKGFLSENLINCIIASFKLVCTVNVALLTKYTSYLS